jgi:hypothetical protein
MIRRIRNRLRPPGAVVRGRPHFVAGPPVGPRGMVAWIPEGRVVGRGARRRVAPVAIIELHATGVRRHPLRAGRTRLLMALGLGCVLAGLGWWGIARRVR